MKDRDPGRRGEDGTAVYRGGVLSGMPTAEDEKNPGQKSRLLLCNDGARGGTRTRTPVAGKRILSPLRLPVSPPGQVETIGLVRLH